MTATRIAVRQLLHPLVLASLLVPAVCLFWAYWTTLGEITFRWNHDPQYSHGYLVPAFALALLWVRRQQLPELPLRPSVWGLALVAAGVAMRLGGTYWFFAWFDAASLVLCLAGMCLAVGGWPAWRWAWPSLAFLMFMIPLPHRLAVALTDPLQRIATVASTFMLQTFGLPAVADGHLIHLNEIELGVVEACSGLRMLMTFIALSTAVVLVIRRPVWEKLVLVVSAVPIALLVNMTRITATGILHETAGRAVADAVFHDLAGWLMMPMALGLMWLELQVLQRLFLDPTDDTARPDLRMPAPAAPAMPRRQKWVKPQPAANVAVESVQTP
jgi:exosortase